MMPRAFPKGFPEDDFEVALGREYTIARVAQDFGISESCVQHWVNFVQIILKRPRFDGSSS